MPFDEESSGDENPLRVPGTAVNRGNKDMPLESDEEMVAGDHADKKGKGHKKKEAVSRGNGEEVNVKVPL